MNLDSVIDDILEYIKEKIKEYIETHVNDLIMEQYTLTKQLNNQLIKDNEHLIERNEKLRTELSKYQVKTDLENWFGGARNDI